MASGESNETAPLWTAEEAAAFLKVKVSTVKQWAKLGKIPHRRAGDLIRFDRDELDQWTREGGARVAAEKGVA